MLGFNDMHVAWRNLAVLYVETIRRFVANNYCPQGNTSQHSVKIHTLRIPPLMMTAPVETS